MVPRQSRAPRRRVRTDMGVAAGPVRPIPVRPIEEEDHPTGGPSPARPGPARGLAYFGGVVGLGRFRCEPGSELWREENQIGVWPLAAFPENVVRIRQAGHDEVVSNPNQAMLYRAGQPYRRGLV